MYKLFISLISIALLSSCSEKKNILYENDTDFHDWINQQNIKNVSNPHSGFSSCVLDSTHEYSLGFSKTIQKISAKPIKKIKFSYWAFLKNDLAKATTVFSVDFNGKNINWDGRPLAVRETNKWIQVQETYQLPKVAQPNNEISFYVWNNSKQEIWIDDLKIEFE